VLEVALTRSGGAFFELQGGVDVRKLACVLHLSVSESGAISIEHGEIRDIPGGVRVETRGATAAAPGDEAVLAHGLASRTAPWQVAAVVGEGDDRLTLVLSASETSARLVLGFARAADAPATEAWIADSFARAGIRGVRVKRAGAEVTLDVDQGGWEAAALALQGSVIEAFREPSESMTPSVLQGDHIYVAKGSFAGTMPHRGDVVAFRSPRDPDVILVKRVVGIAGDHVRVDDRTLLLGDKPVPATREGDFSYQDLDPNTGRTETRQGQIWREELDGRSYRTLRYIESYPSKSADVVVPAGQVFLLGDNRDHSHDSRFIGTVPVANIVGRVIIIWWSSGSDGDRMERVGLRL
jgi:signal peptidase I